LSFEEEVAHYREFREKERAARDAERQVLSEEKTTRKER
jgi:hypothetical protein